MVSNSTTVDAGRSVGDFLVAGSLLGFEGTVGAPGPHLHWQVSLLDPSDPLSDYDNGWPRDWSDGGWVGSPDLLPSICGIGIMDAGDEHVAAPCPSQSRARMTKRVQDVAVSLRWTKAQQANTVAILELSAPDRLNRVTLSRFSLDGPVSLQVSPDTGLPWPTGAVVVLDRARLVRPVTFALDHDGTAVFPADQLVLATELSIVPPGGPVIRSERAGPLSGSVRVSLSGRALGLSFDAGRLGTVVGSGQLRAFPRVRGSRASIVPTRTGPRSTRTDEEGLR